MTVTTEGARFQAAVRRAFAPLFHEWGFVEVGARDDYNGAIVTAKNATHYLSLSCDFRDSYVDSGIGRLREDLVPPPPIAPAREPSGVRQLAIPLIVWQATGDKEASFALCSYTTEESIDATVEGMAQALQKYGSPILAGDQDAWDKVAELTISRVWRR